MILFAYKFTLFNSILLDKSIYVKINDLFPKWKEFIIFAGFFIWLLELIFIFLKHDNNLLNQDLVVETLIFSVEFIQGYSLGIITPLFHHYYKKRKKKFSVR